jgi:hypothetical protein
MLVGVLRSREEFEVVAKSVTIPPARQERDDSALPT